MGLVRGGAYTWICMGAAVSALYLPAWINAVFVLLALVFAGWGVAANLRAGNGLNRVRGVALNVLPLLLYFATGIYGMSSLPED